MVFVLVLVFVFVRGGGFSFVRRGRRGVTAVVVRAPRDAPRGADGIERPARARGGERDLGRGRVDAAVDALRSASVAPAAEGLTYRHGVAAWRVLPDLVDAGEQAAVVDFLEAMAERNLADRDRLLAAADDVRGGRPPSRLFRRANPAAPR